MSAASSYFRQNGDYRLAATGRNFRSGFHEQTDGISWLRAMLYMDTRDPRDDARVPRAHDRQAPIIRQESEGGIPRRIRGQPGGESGRH